MVCPTSRSSRCDGAIEVARHLHRQHAAGGQASRPAGASGAAWSGNQCSAALEKISAGGLSGCQSAMSAGTVAFIAAPPAAALRARIGGIHPDQRAVGIARPQAPEPPPRRRSQGQPHRPRADPAPAPAGPARGAAAGRETPHSAAGFQSVTAISSTGRARRAPAPTAPSAPAPSDSPRAIATRACGQSSSRRSLAISVGGRKTKATTEKILMTSDCRMLITPSVASSRNRTLSVCACGDLAQRPEVLHLRLAPPASAAPCRQGPSAALGGRGQVGQAAAAGSTGFR